MFLSPPPLLRARLPVFPRNPTWVPEELLQDHKPIRYPSHNPTSESGPVRTSCRSTLTLRCPSGRDLSPRTVSRTPGSVVGACGHPRLVTPERTVGVTVKSRILPRRRTDPSVRSVGRLTPGTEGPTLGPETVVCETTGPVQGEDKHVDSSSPLLLLRLTRRLLCSVTVHKVCHNPTTFDGQLQPATATRPRLRGTREPRPGRNTSSESEHDTWNRNVSLCELGSRTETTGSRHRDPLSGEVREGRLPYGPGRDEGH